MKKIIIIIIVLNTILSCSISDDSPVTTQELLPVKSVTIPENFALNETYEIELRYLRPTNCHGYRDIYFSKNNNERTVAIISTYFLGNENCTPFTNEELETSFNFKATELGSYIFKFWKGLDDNGEDIYLIIEVPVL